ncbi:hypothetical protein CP985_08670 [Malaciobacter mytili LMG 24559]|uniref:Flagellar hook-length control protein FliK n=1 Tax=Malaciobacter mytili LMG 24559 TaxID=1032238 RepID=A0AAX2AES1_9BACT|nr:hypothetical protein [Malaciobacter mytili]AXH15749.1 flagellar hook-length control protein FliK [Malaciobacter mytili LMG 24559]RXK15428.1 hypothetical protein CP985_08670 [Malaciobacter mytili LMG 24559]
METIDLLSSSKIKGENTSSSTTSNEVKKEGFSLFDSLLSEASSENIAKSGNSKEEVNNKSNENTGKNSISLNTTTEEKTEIKTANTIENKVENKSEKVQTEVQTSSVKTDSSSLSLLDRMLLEAQKSISNEATAEEITSNPLNSSTKEIPSSNEILNNIKNRQTPQETLVSKEENSKNITSEKTQDTTISNNNKEIENKIENPNGKINNDFKKELNNEQKVENKVENKTEDLVEDKKIEKPNLDTAIAKNSQLNQENNIEVITAENSSQISTDDTLEMVEDSKGNIKNNESAQVLKEIKNSEVIIENKSINTTATLDIDTSKNETQKLVIQPTQDKTSIQKTIVETSNLNEKILKDNETSTVLNPSTPLDKGELVVEDNNTKETLTNKEKATLDKELSTKVVNEAVLSKPAQEEVSVKTDVVKEVKTQENLATETKVIDKKIENNELEIKAVEEKKNINNESTISKNTATSVESTIDETLASTKNEKVANELAKIDNTTASENKKVQIGTQELKDTSLENEQPASKKTLIEKLVEEDNSLKKEEIIQTKVETKTEEKTVLNTKNDLLTNIYLSSQKNSITNQAIIAQHEGVKIAKEANNIEDIKKSAKILELELTEAKVEIKDNASKEISKNTILEKMIMNRNLVQEFTNSNLPTQVTSSLTQSGLAGTQDNTIINEMPDVSLTVPSTLAMSIQSKIIGARQQMSSMMSDIARTMYENYKPPVTAFRINLFPAQLGTIAILMKNDRENGGLNISLNISSSSTLEAFVDNETGLKSALLKTFESEGEFNLDFNSDENSQNSSSNNPQEQQASTRRESLSSNEILNSLNSNKNSKADISNYM